MVYNSFLYKKSLLKIWSRMRYCLKVWRITNLLLAIFFGSMDLYAGEIPLGWKPSVGVEERFRYEFRKDYDFNETRKDNGSLFFHRLRLNGKLVFNNEEAKEKLELFWEGLDAQTGGYQLKPLANQVDDFDFFQGYIKAQDIAGSRVDVKIGRQILEYGKGRLIGAPAFNNRMRSFDAAVAHIDQAGFYSDLIYGQTVNYDDNNFNRSREDEKLGGFYGGFQKEKESPLFEGYFLSLWDHRTAAHVERYTVGARHSGKVGGEFQYDLEVPFQFGELVGRDIRAWALHADINRTWKQLKWKPKMTLEYNQATGDQDPNDDEANSFVPLYQSTHTPYGQMDFFRWQNMRELAGQLVLAVHEKLKLTGETNFFWLESNADSWFNSAGVALRTKTSGERGYYVGQEVSLRANYELNKHVKFEVGAAHFFTGEYVRDTGADDDADWLYSQVVLKY